MTETVDKAKSFAYFVYPFLFDLPDAPSPERKTANSSSPDPFSIFAGRIAETTLENKRIWTDWGIPVNDLMPHVARFLDPDPKNKKPTGRFWQLSNDVAQKLQTNKIVWRMLRGKTGTPIPFTLGGDFLVQLALFRHGVGFITVSAQPVSNELDAWLAFLHDFRFMSHRSDVRVCAERETYDPGSKQKATAPYNPLNVPLSANDNSFYFIEVIKAFLKASGIGATEVFTPGHTLPYTSLFVRGAAENDKPTILHRLRNFFGPEQGSNTSPDDLSPNHAANLAYARDQWFLQTLNGGSFLSFDDENTPGNDFQNNDLTKHTGGVYFCANLLVLYQRFTLARLSERVATKALEDGTDKEWETIRDDLLDFTARGHFAQAMQSDHHHRYYRKWQEVLQIPQLYEEVRNEVRDMYERAVFRLRQEDDKREKREEDREKLVAKRLSLFGLLFAIPALILAFLGVNIREYPSGLPLMIVSSWFLGGFVLAALAYWILVKFWDREPT